MRYKLLLLGGNETIIDDVYNKTEDNFEIQTSSMRFSDIKSHIRYFKPDALVYALYRENGDSLARISTIKQNSVGAHIPLITIGDEGDTNEFRKRTVNIASMILIKPLTVTEIRNKITSFLDVLNEEKDPEEDSVLSEDVRIAAKARKEEKELARIEDELFGTPKQPEHKRKTILVVDDDVRMLKVIKRHLEEEFEVATATSGIVALRYMRKRSVDLVLLDYMMPNMNGADVLRKIRGDSTLKDLPVLFLTGASEREKIAEALTYHPQGYMLKPVDKEVLMAKLHEFLDDGKTPQSSNPFR